MNANPAVCRILRGARPGILSLALVLPGCGRKEAGPARTGLGRQDSVVLGSPATTALSNQGVVSLTRRALAETLEVPFRIEADVRRSIRVVAPAAGRLEEVFVRTPDQAVKSGERLALLYSPELVTAQRDFLLLDPGEDPVLTRQSEDLLQRMGLSTPSIRSIRASGKPMVRIPILSPKAGFVLEAPSAGTDAMDKNAIPSDPGMGGSMGGGQSGGYSGGNPEGSMGGMSGAGASGPQGAPAAVTSMRTGAYVTRGTVLAQINDLVYISATLSIPVRTAALFRAGDSVHFVVETLGFAAMARLDFLESRVADSGGNVQALAYLPNPGFRLKLGVFGKAHLIPKAETTWVLPRPAVHNLGERQMVWVRSKEDSGVFLAQEVRIGRMGERLVEILDGLSPGATVAENASLLLDPDVVLELRPTPEPGATPGEPADHAQGHSAPAEKEGHGTHPAQGGSGSEHSGSGHGSAAATLTLPENQVRLAGIRSARAGYAHLAPAQVFRGMTQFDARSQEMVPTRVEGRIETVPVPRPGEKVRRGQTLATIQSEALLSAQEEYLVARRSASKPSNLELIRSQVQASRRRLQVLGMTDVQVAALERRGQAISNLPIVSPRDGILLEVRVQPGQYVTAGTPLFTVGLADRIWVETWLLAQEAAAYPEGTEASVRVEGLADGPLSGRLEHVRQETALSGSTTLAHVGIDNPDHRILPGMQAWVTFHQAGKHVLCVPASALLRSSTSTMAWVEADRNTFVPRKVRTGLETADSVEILSGIAEGEAVVVSGVYLLNSEWTLRQGAGMIHAGH